MVGWKQVHHCCRINSWLWQEQRLSNSYTCSANSSWRDHHGLHYNSLILNQTSNTATHVCQGGDSTRLPVQRVCGGKRTRKSAQETVLSVLLAKKLTKTTWYVKFTYLLQEHSHNMPNPPHADYPFFFSYLLPGNARSGHILDKWKKLVSFTRAGKHQVVHRHLVLE